MSEGGNGSIAIKVISMGAPKTGKSCLIKRYCEKRFVSKYLATLGIDFGVTTVTIKGRKVKVNIFDMGGEQFFYEVRNEFYKGTDGALLVYDVTDRASFENLSVWLSEMKGHMTTEEDYNNVAIVVCGNKIDVSSRQVSETEGRLWAETRGFSYYETSALANTNVFEVFECLFDGVILSLSGSKPARKPTDFTNEQLHLVQSVLNSANKDSANILGVKHNATREDIVKAYKHLAVLLHPDKNSVPGSEEAFKILCSAKDDLLLNH